MIVIIMWALAHYQMRPMELRTDKRGIPFVSASFIWPPVPVNPSRRDKPFTFWVKSMAIYTTKKGGYLLLLNIGGIKNGRTWSGTTRLVIRPNRHSWTIFEKGKYKGNVYAGRTYFPWEAMLPIDNAPQNMSSRCDCSKCKTLYEFNEWGTYRVPTESKWDIAVPDCTCDDCTPF